MQDPPTLADIEAAASRIRGHVRVTPTVAAAPARDPLPGDTRLTLECLQVTGSFKPRGATNAIALLTPERRARGVVTASGGNHGLAVAYAAHRARMPATVYVPETTGPAKRRQIAAWGATVRVEGAVWDESAEAALAHGARTGACFVHPFADPAVIAGQGTLGLELLAAAPDADTVLVAIGGGGLIAGVAIALKARRADLRVVGVEPTGAATLHASRRAGAVVTLPRIDTAAVTLAPRRSDPLPFAVVERLVDDLVLVDDDQMRAAAAWLWSEHAVASELSGAATVAALQTGAYRPAQGERVVAIVCGAGRDGLPPTGEPG